MKFYRSNPIKLSDKFFSNTENIERDVQILRAGKFFHNDVEIEITKEDLKRMVQNFKENVRKIDLMIDFSHESDKEAAAWIQDIYLAEDGQELWAVVDWTEDGEEAVRKKKYRYLSADFQFNYKDNETLQEHGPTLFGAGLTNRPVVKGMAPTILSESKSEEEMTEETKKKMAELEEKLAERDKKIKELEEKITAMEKDKKMAEEKLAEDKKLAEEKAKKDKELAEKKSKFDTMLSEGKVCEAQRDAFMKDDMKEFIEKQAEVKLDENGNNNTPNYDDKNTSVEDKILNLAEKKMKEDDSLDIGTAQSLVLAENKELEKEYNALFQEK